MFQANQRVEEYKQQIKSLTVRLKEVKKRIVGFKPTRTFESPSFKIKHQSAFFPN